MRHQINLKRCRFKIAEQDKVTSARSALAADTTHRARFCKGLSEAVLIFIEISDTNEHFYGLHPDSFL
jgi:hypothetical protein